MEYQFGTGVLYGRNIPSSGVATPIRFGGLQDVSIDIQYTVKELYGQYQFPIAIGRGTGKISGKASWAQFNAQAFNDLFFGQSTLPAGEVKTAVAEAQTVTANIITVTNNSTYLQDLGVVLASTGVPLTRVANAPVSGNYSCNETTGVYTFNSGQNATAMLVSYTYNDASNGKKISITNQLLGNAPTFICVLTNTFNGKQLTLNLNSCMSHKLTLATKLQDFTIPQFDFQAFADASNNIGTMSMDE